MQHEHLVSVALIDNRPPATLSALYETPAEDIPDLQDALAGNAPAFLARHAVAANDLPTAARPTETKLIGAVALLNGFVRANFTGPFDLPAGDAPADETEYLAIDGEKANPLTQHAAWLHAAAKTLGVLRDAGVFLLEWFVARQAAVHQRVLENPSSSLTTRLDENFRRAAAALAAAPFLPAALAERLQEKCAVEHAAALFASSQFRRYNEVMRDIALKLKIFVELSGAMGKRTKFQEKETAQLFVAVDRRPNRKSEFTRQACADLLKEAEVDAESDVLSNPEYSQDIDYTPLSASDEGVVLLTAMNFYRRHAKDELILEQLIPFPSRVLRDRLDFATFLMACLLKSRYEATVSHFLWRAIRQASDVAAYLEGTAVAPEERLESVHLVLLPPIFLLRKEIGMRMLLMGDAAAAIGYFTAVNMKTEIVAAYVSLRDNERAERVCRELLASGKREPELLCLMYEITKDPAYLEEAWAVSNKTYIHAQRVLGLHAFNAQDWKTAKEHFDVALSINPLYQRVWYALGVCCVQLNDMEGARTAFKKGIAEAKPCLLEPVMKLEIIVPDDYVGDVMGDMNKRRGKILGMEPLAEGGQKLMAEAPQAELFDYAIVLRSMTQARGNFSMHFERYEEVPAQIAQKIIAAHQAEQEK